MKRYPLPPRSHLGSIRFPAPTLVALLAAVILCLHNPASAYAYTGSRSGSTGTDVPITDYNTSYSGIAISGAPAGAVIESIDVSFNIDHDYTRDLRIWLGTNSWNNESDPLAYHPAPTGDDWLDSWSQTVNMSTSYSSSDSWFLSQAINQTWYLAVHDDYGYDEGRIDSWSITIHYRVRETLVVDVYNSSVNTGSSVTVYGQLDGASSDPNGKRVYGYLVVGSSDYYLGYNDTHYDLLHGGNGVFALPVPYYLTDDLCGTSYTVRAEFLGDADWYPATGTGTLTVNDTLAPGAPTSVTDNVSGWSSDNTPTFSWSAPSDPCGVKGYYWSTSDPSPDSGDSYTTARSVTVPPQADGSRTFYVAAVDYANNIGGPGSHAFSIDSSPPPAPSNVNDGVSGWNGDTTPTFTWSAPSDTSGIAGYRWSTTDPTPDGDDGWTTATSVTVPPQSSGYHTFYVAAVNGAGLIGSPGSHSFQTDGTAPYTPGTPDLYAGDDSGQSNSDNITNDSSLRFDWAASGDTHSGLAGYWLAVDDSSPESGGSWTTVNSITGVAAGEGSHTLYLRAQDNVGNLSAVTSLAFTIDRTAPAPPTFVSPAEYESVRDTTPLLDWSWISGVWTYQAFVSEAGAYPPESRTSPALTASQWEVSPQLGYKDWEWQVRATDIAGNVGAYGRNGVAGAWGHFTVEGPPLINSLSPTSGPVGKRVIILGSRFGDSQLTGYTLRIGGVTAVVESWSATEIVVYVPMSLGTGTTSMVVHTWTDSNSVSFTVTPPVAVDLYNYTIGTIQREVNVPFDLCATVRNSGGSAADHGGLAFSLAELTAVSGGAMPPYTSPLADVTTGGGTTFAGSEIYYRDHGDLIYDNSDNQFPAEYLMVEGERANWPAGESRTLCLQVTPKQLGPLTVYVRGWMAVGGEWGYGPPNYYEPTSGAQDQQDYYVYPLTVNVVATPQITAISPTSGPVGKRVTIQGSGFGDTQLSGYTARMGGVTAAVESWSDTEVVIYVPMSLSTGTKSVVVHTWTDSNSVTYTVTPPVAVDLYNYPTGTLQRDVNVPFDLCASVTNSGGSPADHGGLAFSLPQLTAVSGDPMPPYTSAVAEVGKGSGTTFLDAELYFRDHGTLIWDNADNEFPAEYLLVEGERANWPAGESRTLCLRITPHQPGPLTVYVRGWMTVGGEWGYGPPAYREPTSGPQDQQGYFVYPVTINVNAPEAEIVSRLVAPGSIIEGEAFQIVVEARNAGTLAGWGGISVSFPEITYRGLEADVFARTSIPGAEAVKYFEHGDEIHDDDGPMAADYLLVEAAMDDWQPGATETLTITVVPKETGSFPVYTRFAMTSNGFASRVPASSGTLDQQDYPVVVNWVSVGQPAVAVDVPILMYHKVSPVRYSEWWVTKNLFQNQMAALAAYGYTPVGFDDFIAYRRGTQSPPSKPIILTFDDGYLNLMEHAYPTLEALSFPSTSFLPTGMIGANDADRHDPDEWDSYPESSYPAPHLIWPEVQSMQAEVAFEGHSRTHPFLDTLSDGEVWDEVYGCRLDIESHLGSAASIFSYPFGIGPEDPRLRGMVQEAGYSAAVAAGGGIENTGTADMWALQRIMISDTHSITLDPANPDDFFMRKVDPDFPLPLIDILSVAVLDLNGEPRSRFYPGETVHFIVSAHNSGDTVEVTVSLNASQDTSGATPPLYDSHLTDPVEDVTVSFATGTTRTFEYYWTLPEETATGQYYHTVGFHDVHYVLGFRYLNWVPSFTVGPISEIDMPAPSLTTQSDEWVPVPWRQVISDTVSYQINAYALPEDLVALQTRLASSPLYGYRTDSSLVQGVVVLGPGSEIVSDPTLARELVVANNNISHFRYDMVWDAYEGRALDEEYLVQSEMLLDQYGNEFQVWAPAQANGWWRELFLYPALSNYDARLDRYQDVLTHLVLQPEITQRMVEDGSAFDQFIATAIAGLTEGAGGVENAGELIEALRKMRLTDTGLITTLTDDDYLAIWSATYCDWVPPTFYDQQVTMLEAANAILGPLGIYLEINNEVLRMQFEDSLANQMAFMRMDQIGRWIEANEANLDPALVEAFGIVEQDVTEMAATVFDSHAAMMESAFDEFGDWLNYADYALGWAHIANTLFLHKASLGLVSHTASQVLLPYMLAYEIGASLVEDLDHMRNITLAATLYQQFKAEFAAREAEVVGGDNDVRLVTDVGLLNSYGHYLAHYYFTYYLEVVSLGDFWDWINPINWPKIIGEALAGEYGSRQEVIDAFESEIDHSYDSMVFSALAPHFTTRNETLEWLGSMILTEAAASSGEVTELLLAVGAEGTVTFQVGNSGGTADPFYLDVSYPDELELVSPEAGWQLIPAGTTVWGAGDILAPTHVTTEPLAELSEPFPAGQPEQVYSLIFRGDSLGQHTVRYRVAMIPEGLTHAETLVQRVPTDGPLDQQEFPARTIDVTVMPPPDPAISANITSLDLAIGEVRTFELTLDNAGGGAASDTYIDISATGGLTVTDVSPAVNWSDYAVGDLIWHQDGSQFPAVNFLYSMAAPDFPAGGRTTYRVTVKAVSQGSYTLSYRTALNPMVVEPDYLGDSFVRDPAEAGAGVGIDQQGWYAFQIPVTVRPNLPPVISDALPSSPVTITAGVATPFQASAYDPEGQPLTYHWYVDGEPLETDGNAISYAPAADDLDLHSIIVYADDGIYQTYTTWEIHVVDGTPPAIYHTAVALATENSPVRIAASILDAVGVTEARLYYRTAGAPTYTALPLAYEGGDTWAATIPGPSVVSPALDYYLWASDGPNQALHGSDAAPHVITVSPLPDLEPPTIVHTPVSESTAGDDLMLDAWVVDNVAVVEVTLYYRPGGEALYSTLALNNLSGDDWQVVIPGPEVLPPTLEYYLTASDGSNTATDGTAGAPHVVAVADAPDLIPPVIDHLPVTETTENSAVQISASISDDTGVVEAQLNYRVAGTPLYTVVALAPQGGDAWAGQIPAAAVTTAGVEYYLTASDGTNTATHGSSALPHLIAVAPAGDNVPPTIQHTTVPTATAGTSILIQAIIDDNVGVASASLLYRRSGDIAFNAIAMLARPDDLWEATIPAGAVTLQGVDYAISASDGSNMTTAGTYTVQVVPDEVPPVIVHDPVTQVQLGQMVPISATVTDNLAVVDVRLAYRTTGSGDYQEQAMTLQGNARYVGSIPAGVVTAAGADYYLVAHDALNETEHGSPAAPHHIEAIVDTTPPTAVIVAPVMGQVISSTTTLAHGTATDAMSMIAAVQVSRDGGVTWTSANGTTSWSYLMTVAPAEGASTTLAARAIDAAGNIQSPPSEVTVTVDTVAPTGWVLIDGDSDYANSRSVTLSIDADDGWGVDSMRVANSGGAYGDWIPYRATLGWELAAGDGETGVLVQVRDLAGNVSTFGDQIVLDTEPPDSVASSPAAESAATIAVSWVITDTTSGPDGVRLQVRFNDGSWEETGLTDSDPSGVFTYAPLQGDGHYAFRTVASDLAGNQEVALPEEGDTATVYDTVAPVSAASSPPLMETRVVTVSWTAGDERSGLAAVELWVSYERRPSTLAGEQLGPGAAGAFYYTFDRGPGSYGFYTVARDTAGNREAAPETADTSTLYDPPIIYTFLPLLFR